MQDSSTDNITRKQDKGQASSAEPHPKDGHLRLPNHIVERLAKLRLNGTQWRILWAVWRLTLCWQRPGEWRNRPWPIGTSELADACGINAQQVKREMGGLVKMNIIHRDNTPGGRGRKPTTAFNLDSSTWNVSLNGSEIATLKERVTDMTPFTEQKGSESVTPTMEEVEEKGSELVTPSVADSLPFTDRSATLSVPNSKLLKKHKRNYKETTSTKVEGDKSPDSLAAQTPASKYLFEKTGRKRWKNLVQKEEFERAEAEVGFERMKEAIVWALLSGISNIKSIITAARRGRHGEPTRRSPESLRRRETGTGGRCTQAPTHEDYIASLPPSQRSGKQ